MLFLRGFRNFILFECKTKMYIKRIIANNKAKRIWKDKK